MLNTRKEFKDREKAQIFKRDRATCCFSGANLWLLDAPLFHHWEADWVDHVKPASRGGKTEIRNGVCASATYNVKKRNNSADTAYLFKEGCPTPMYFELFGPPPPAVTERLQRLSHLEVPDWYFNKAIDRVFQALDYNCWKSENDYKRDALYWYRAAYRRLQIYQRTRSDFPSLMERGIIKSLSETQTFLLSLGDCESLEAFMKAASSLSPKYNRNAKIWWDYFYGGGDQENPKKEANRRRRIYDKICEGQEKFTADTFNSIQADFKIRFPDG